MIRHLLHVLNGKIRPSSDPRFYCGSATISGRTQFWRHLPGGRVASAASAGDRISGLALLGVGATMPVHPDLLAATKSNDPAAWDLIVSWGFGKPAHFGLNKAPGMWMQGGGRSLLARAPGDVLGIDMAACDVFKDALDAAAKVACPTLIIAGDRDMMTPPKRIKKALLLPKLATGTAILRTTSGK